jgi:hypothetical protein
MDGVREEGNTPRKHRDNQLKAGGDEQAHTRPFKGPQAASGCDDGRISEAMKMAMACVLVWMGRRVSMMMDHGNFP